MLENKIILSTGGIVLLAPAKPFIALMGIGVITVGVSLYYLTNIFDSE